MSFSARTATLLLAAAGAGAVLVHSSVFAPRELKVRRRAVTIAGLPEAFHGFTILHLSDLHIGTMSGATTHVLAAGSLKVDLVAVTGDMVETYASAESCGRLLGSLRAEHGIVCVLGNHDHQAFRRRWGQGRGLVPILAEHGVATLVNQSTVIEHGGARLWLVGVDDPYKRRDDAARAFSAVPPDEPRILLAHSPDIFSSLAGQRADLVLTGHCHGGQVRAPWGAIITRTRRRFPDVLGLQWIDGMPVNMSAGLGSPIPLRFLCPPEVTVLHLSAG